MTWVMWSYALGGIFDFALKYEKWAFGFDIKVEGVLGIVSEGDFVDFEDEIALATSRTSIL